jgi:hypothetical protein
MVIMDDGVKEQRWPFCPPSSVALSDSDDVQTVVVLRPAS